MSAIAHPLRNAMLLVSIRKFHWLNEPAKRSTILSRRESRDLPLIFRFLRVSWIVKSVEGRVSASYCFYPEKCWVLRVWRRLGVRSIQCMQLCSVREWFTPFASKPEMGSSPQSQDDLAVVLKNKRICRFCLSQKEPLTNIYSKENRVNSTAPLPLQIMSCVSIEVCIVDFTHWYVVNTMNVRSRAWIMCINWDSCNAMCVVFCSEPNILLGLAWISSEKSWQGPAPINRRGYSFSCWNVLLVKCG